MNGVGLQDEGSDPAGVTEQTLSHHSRFFFFSVLFFFFCFVFSRAPLAAFRGGPGLILISLQPLFMVCGPWWTQTSYHPGGSRNEVVGEACLPNARL